MKISAIILNYNTPEMTERALGNLVVAAKKFELEIILIENGSSKQVAQTVVDGYKIATIVNGENYGFAKAVNQGLKLATGDYVLLLNSDALLEIETLNRLVGTAVQRKNIGIVGPKFVYPNGEIQPTCGLFPDLSRELLRFTFISRYLKRGTVTFPNQLNVAQFILPQQVDWVSGGCMLIKREVLISLKQFDENYFFGVEDIDFCLRAQRMGWQVAYNPEAVTVHFHGFSSGGKRSDFGQRAEMSGMLYFIKKHYPEQRFFYGMEKFLYSLKLWKNKLVY